MHVWVGTVWLAANTSLRPTLHAVLVVRKPEPVKVTSAPLGANVGVRVIVGAA